MKGGVLVAVFACTLVACRLPWTVRPIDATESDKAGPAPFEPAKYAMSIWDSKVVPAGAAAPDFATARRSGRPELVKGTGHVLRVDTDRARLLLDVAPYDGKPDAKLAFGQIHGTALRDALPFVQFSQFVNQVDFAHAASALNDRAALAASPSVAGVSIGSVLSFAGALDVSTANGLPEIIPIVVTREPARP
jgi:predicted lipoprotein